MPIHVFDACFGGKTYTLHVSAENVDKAWDKIAYERPSNLANLSKFTHIDSVPDGRDLPSSPHLVIRF